MNSFRIPYLLKAGALAGLLVLSESAGAQQCVSEHWVSTPEPGQQTEWIALDFPMGAFRVRSNAYNTGTKERPQYNYTVEVRSTLDGGPLTLSVLGPSERELSSQSGSSLTMDPGAIKGTSMPLKKPSRIWVRISNPTRGVAGTNLCNQTYKASTSSVSGSTAPASGPVQGVAAPQGNPPVGLGRAPSGTAGATTQRTPAATKPPASSGTAGSSSAASRQDSGQRYRDSVNQAFLQRQAADRKAAQDKATADQRAFDAGIETVQALGTAIFGSAAEREAKAAKKDSDRREEYARVGMGYEERRIARLAEIGERPLCAATPDPIQPIAVGQTRHGSMTGRECRRKDRNSVVVYSLDLPKARRLEIDVLNDNVQALHSSWYVSDSTGQFIVRGLNSRHEADLDAGRNYISVAGGRPAESGAYGLRVRQAFQSILGRITLEVAGESNSFSSPDLAEANGTSGAGGHGRIAVAPVALGTIGHYLQLFAGFGTAGAGGFIRDMSEFGARVYANSPRARLRYFGEGTYLMASTLKDGTGSFSSMRGFDEKGTSFGIGAEWYFDPRISASLTTNKLSMEVTESDGTMYTVKGLRLRSGIAVHLW